jgi:hypothetical protein
MCSYYGKYNYFNPINCPQEQWLEVQIFTSTGKLISQTQVYNPKRPISVYFGVCAIIAKITIYQPQGIDNTCRGLAWEKAYMSSDKYMCWGDKSLPYNDANWNYWSFFSWARQKAEPSAILQKGAPSAPVTL